MTHYGFLGLGIMGTAMARNLLRAGFEVTVWNRNPEKTKELVKEGAHAAKTPRDVASTCSITFAMLADPTASRSVFFDPDGVIEGIGAGHDYIDLSTVDAQTAQEIAAAVAQKGARFLEAPVSGTKKPAEDGTLIFLAAGDPSLYEQAAKALDVMGKKSVYLGAVGQGARMKLIVNMIMGSMMVAFGEGMALAMKAGLEGATLLNVIESGAMNCPMFKGKGPLLLANTYPTSFPLKHMQKDLRLALALGAELGQKMPAISSANETFKRACDTGSSNEDLSAVFRVIKSNT